MTLVLFWCQYHKLLVCVNYLIKYYYYYNIINHITLHPYAENFMQANMYTMLY